MSGPSGQPTGIGARTPSRVANRLLTGRGRYVADVQLPGMVHAVFVRSPHAHAWVRGIDARTAAEAPGVHAVFTAADFPPTFLASDSRRDDLASTPQPVLAEDRVRFVGEAVAVVIAQTQYQAEDAADLVAVEYEVLPAALDATRAPAPDAVPLADGLEANLVFDETARFGDPSAAFASAAHTVRIRLAIGRTSASPMETRGCVASFDLADEALTVWASTQGPHRLRNKIARASGFPEHRINVMMHDVGGGFGQKIPAAVEEIACALATLRLARPVKWVEDRREHLLAAPHSRGSTLETELAIDAAGVILGMRATIWGDAGAYSFNSGSSLTEPFLTARRMPGCYRIPAYEYRVTSRLTNKTPIAPYRGVGNVAAQIARELALDTAAAAAGLDRVEIRRRNIVTRDELPFTTCTGMVLESGSFLEAFDRALEILDLEKWQASVAAARTSGRHLGLGFSVFVEATGAGSELARQLYGKPNPAHDTARVSFDLSGKATVSFGTTAQGQGIETTMAQVAADVLGLPVDDVQVAQADTRSTPLSTAGTRASRVAVVMSGALGRAAEKVRDQILRVAAHLLEVHPRDLEITDGRVAVVGDPSTGLSVAEVVHAGLTSLGVRSVEPGATFTATELYDPGPTYSNGALACIVEADPETGHVEVLRVVGVDDCGTVINPAVVDGQLRGGIAQGIGSALYEELAYDETGQPLATTLVDFLLPSPTESVDVELDHLHTPSPNTWRGIKGVGESGAIGMPAAVVTAVADAVGDPGLVASLPLLPHVVSSLFDRAGKQQAETHPTEKHRLENDDAQRASTR